MNQQTTVHTTDRADASDQGPVLLHVWMLEPHMADRHLAGRTSIATIVEMRTVEDRQRLEHLPQAHDVLYQLRPAANMVLRLYDESRGLERGLRGSHPAQVFPDPVQTPDGIAGGSNRLAVSARRANTHGMINVRPGRSQP